MNRLSPTILRKNLSESRCRLEDVSTGMLAASKEEVKLLTLSVEDVARSGFERSLKPTDTAKHNLDVYLCRGQARPINLNSLILNS